MGRIGRRAAIALELRYGRAKDTASRLRKASSSRFRENGMTGCCRAVGSVRLHRLCAVLAPMQEEWAILTRTADRSRAQPDYLAADEGGDPAAVHTQPQAGKGRLQGA
jgi:hypothetical protein